MLQRRVLKAVLLRCGSWCTRGTRSGVIDVEDVPFLPVSNDCAKKRQAEWQMAADKELEELAADFAGAQWLRAVKVTVIGCLWAGHREVRTSAEPGHSDPDG
jgi:hypothetical protein